MGSADNLIARLMTPGRDPDEVLEVLQRQYSHGQDDGEGSITLSSGPEPELQVSFGKYGPVAVRALLGFDQARFEAAAARVAEVLDGPHRTTVYATVLFASRPVESAYRDPGGHFQILPVPPNAPRPDEAWAEHPFLFEFTVRASSDLVLTTWRANRSAYEWTWFLGAVLRDSVKGQGMSAAKHWVLWPTDMAPPIERAVHWAPEFYSYQGMNARPGEFSVPAVPPMQSIPLADYYPDRSVVMGTKLQLPETFATLTRQFTLATPKVRRLFLRAARWVHTADRSGSLHFGSSHVALVTAIETLVDNDSPDVCASCGQDKYRATARFRDFMARLTAGFDPKAVSEFYAVRSRLVHGTAGLEIDEDRLWTFKPSTNYELDRLRRMRQLVTIVMIRWLEEQSVGQVSSA